MTCRHHPCDIQHATGDGYAYDWCLKCEAVVPLGPANDTPDALVELRAAEIAAHRHDMEFQLSSRFKTNYGEVAGWRGEETIALKVRDGYGSDRTERNVPMNLDSPNWRAGYLARQIAMHEDEHSQQRADDAAPLPVARVVAR